MAVKRCQCSIRRDQLRCQRRACKATSSLIRIGLRITRTGLANTVQSVAANCLGDLILLIIVALDDSSAF